MTDCYCKFAQLIIDGKSNYSLEEHARDCDTCRADQEIERLREELSALNDIATSRCKEVGRLRAALERIAKGDSLVDDLDVIAREALK